MKTFKILGLFLTYPEGTVFNASEELLQTLRSEGILPNKSIQRMERFLKTQKNKDLMDVQADYVDTFDRGRSHCLHLFEHIHGESRDRGQAMVDLRETYATKELHINNGELPDYLPLFLEFLSQCSIKEAKELLGEAIDIIAMIGLKLKKLTSPYAEVFDAIQILSTVKPDEVKIAKALIDSPKDPVTLEELDKEWKEAEAFSIDGLSANCNTCPESINSIKSKGWRS